MSLFTPNQPNQVPQYQTVNTDQTITPSNHYQPYQPPPMYQPPMGQQPVYQPQSQVRRPSMSVSVYRKGVGKVGKDLKYTELVQQIQVGDKVFFGSQDAINKHLPWVSRDLSERGISIFITKPEWQKGRYGSIQFYTRKRDANTPNPQPQPQPQPQPNTQQ